MTNPRNKMFLEGLIVGIAAILVITVIPIIAIMEWARRRFYAKI